MSAFVAKWRSFWDQLLASQWSEVIVHRLSRQVLWGTHGSRLGQQDTLASARLGVAVVAPIPHHPVIFPPKFA